MARRQPSESRLREVFSMFDRDGDGTINRSELAPIMTVLDHRVTPKTLQRVMKTADKDGNGKLDFKEFSLLMSDFMLTEQEEAALEMTGCQHAKETAAKQKRQQNKRLKQVFSMYDRDKDGTINTRELMTIMQTLGNNPTRVQMKKIMKEADRDGNGKLDYPEFVQLMGRYLLSEDEARLEIIEAFRVMDKDDSGYIEFEELKKVLQQCNQSMSDAELQEIFDQLDENGDGRLDIDEFSKLATKGLL